MILGLSSHDLAMKLFLQLAVILAACRLCGWVGRRMGQTSLGQKLEWDQSSWEAVCEYLPADPSAIAARVAAFILLGVRPGLEHAIARRVEDAADYDLPVRSIHNRAALLGGHISSLFSRSFLKVPWLLVLHTLGLNTEGYAARYHAPRAMGQPG